MANAALIFDLLGFPIAPLGDGDLVVLGQRDQLRRVPLRATDQHVLDAARDQSTSPWLLTRSELFLLSAGGNREISFPMDAFGQGGAAGAVLSMLEVHAPLAGSQRRLFALNTVRGAYVLELDGGKLNMLNDEPIDFVACASVAQHGGVALLGSSRRAPNSSGVLQPGHPAIVQVESGAPTLASLAAPRGGWTDSGAAQRRSGASRARARAPLALAPIGPQVIDKLMAAPHGLARNLAAQAVPEAIVAAAGERFLVGLTALPDRLDAVDELAPRMINSEMIGLALVSAQGHLLDVALHTACLGVWRGRDGVERALLGANRGRGGRLADLSTFALDAGCDSLAGIDKVHVDAGSADIGSTMCHAFQPRHHASIGTFGVARIGEPDRAGRGAVLVERDARRWDVIADEQSGPLPLAPLPRAAAS